MRTAAQAKRVEQAAHNNAAWCDTVCRTHGIPGEFRPQIWLNHGPVPPSYPNAVTLADTADVVDQIVAVRELIAMTANTVSVKDSFHKLDLTPLGFQPLFDATWLWRHAAPSIQAVPSGDIQWTTVQAPDLLARWETAWAGVPANGDAAARIFLPALLKDPDVRFMAALHDNLIVAGAIANQTGDVVGLSNQFAASEAFTTYWAGCLNLIAMIYPGLPIVGYEHGAALELARMLGFDEIGTLRVWSRSAE